jgi:hypothetical protein
MPLSDAFYGGPVGQWERPSFMIMRNYLDDLVRLPRDAPVFPGFKELLKLGAIVAV